MQHLLLGLTDRYTPDRVPVETDLDQARERFVAEPLVDPALHDSEKRVGIAFVRRSRALRPARLSAIDARASHAVRIGRALVEHHHDVGIENALDAHRLLGERKQGSPSTGD